ncbi:MAG: ankyrin repeat domain-containing protein [Chlamydiales bacterium]|nr:ankyrin repeat domain-containing protein [Chlamydiales bacterium]
MKPYFSLLLLFCSCGFTLYAEEGKKKLERPQEIHGTLRASLLHEAIRDGRLDQVERVLLLHANPNVRSRDNETTIELAIKQQSAGGRGLDMLKFLIKAGADVNALSSTGETPLSLALKEGQTDTAQYLIDHKANLSKPDKDGDTPIFSAISSNDRDIFKYLLDERAGIDVPNAKGDTALHWALRNQRPDMAMELILANVNLTARNADRSTAVNQAAAKDYFNVVAVLVRRGVPVNLRAGEELNTPMHYAAANADLDMVQFLLDNHANISVQNAKGDTPLHLAAGNPNANVDLIEYMVTHGSVVDTPNSEGSTSLHEAAKVASGGVIDMLIEHGGNSSKRDKQGRTPLYIAGLYRNLAAAKALIERKAPVNDSRPPLEGAIKGGDEDVIKLLIENGAKA